MADTCRIRVTEEQARDFNTVLTDEIIRRRKEQSSAFEAGDQEKIDLAKENLRRLDRLRTQIYDLMREKGWVE